MASNLVTRTRLRKLLLVIGYMRAGQATPPGYTTRKASTTSHDVVLAKTCSRHGHVRKKLTEVTGPLQHGALCKDVSNKMVQTRQYVTEIDDRRGFIALDLTAAFHNESRTTMILNFAQCDVEPATLCSRWCTGVTRHRMLYGHITGSSGVDRECLWLLLLRRTAEKCTTRLDSGVQFHSYFW